MMTLRSIRLEGGPADGRRIVPYPFRPAPHRILFYTLEGGFFYLYERDEFYEGVAKFTPAIDQADGSL